MCRKVPPFLRLFNANTWKKIASGGPEASNSRKQMADAARLSSYAWSGVGFAALTALCLTYFMPSSKQRLADKPPVPTDDKSTHKP
eukprot:CAMPEP_0174261256 /NCGR_PEP_ID=MMETSP0439-20130205/11329_1 /TAXON_ID=0 /ORGANISM="Stereomyxa ramosa, Strain Chinc5" /LENGTH=85 /DNA_ID=CAMNT_0015345709 /DNA_START=28 /DNA_END=285 /DNA_ORIENTATION=+